MDYFKAYAFHFVPESVEAKLYIFDNEIDACQ
jgi:hypothetical protein